MVDTNIPTALNCKARWYYPFTPKVAVGYHAVDIQPVWLAGPKTPSKDVEIAQGPSSHGCVKRATKGNCFWILIAKDLPEPEETVNG